MDCLLVFGLNPLFWKSTVNFILSLTFWVSPRSFDTERDRSLSRGL